MKRILSFILCAVMIFTAIPFSLTASAEGRNPLKTIELSETEITLFYDAYHENDEKELSVSAQGEKSGEEVTEKVTYSWRSHSMSVAEVQTDKDDSSKAVIKAKGLGTAKIIIDAEDESGNKAQAVCNVTVRKSLRSYYESFRVLMAELPEDVDKTPSVYSPTAMALLKSTFDEIQSFFNSEEVKKPYLSWRDDLVALVSAMADTQDNCTVVDNWKKLVMTAFSTLTNSVLAQRDDDEYFGMWDSAYAKLPADFGSNAYIENTVKAVNEIIDEFETSEWIATDESKAKLDSLALRLEGAIKGLRKHTTSFKFTSTKITRNYGSGSFKIPYTADGFDKIEWSSSDDKILYVDQSGYVTIKSAIPEGYNKKVMVFAVIPDSEDNLTQSCEIVILNPITSIKVSERLAVLIGETNKKIIVETFGNDSGCPITENPVFEFVSSDEKIAKVSADGTIIPVSSGKCTVYVSVKGNSLIETQKCAVTISPAQKITQLNKAGGFPTQLTVNATTQAKIRIFPTTATNKTIKWTSSNDKIAKISAVVADGDYSTANITGVSAGRVTITYETTDGSNIKGSFSLNVNPLVKEIILDKKNITTYIGKGEEVIKATCLPENAGNQKLLWYSSDDRVATVVDGKITLKATGTCEIIAETTDTSKVKSVASLIVLGSAQTITMSSAPTKMNTGEKVDLDCEVVTKQGISYQVRDWSVSDTSLASVDSNGVVKALMPGKVTVTAKYFDGNSASKTITIIAPLEGISLPESMTIDIEKTKTVALSFKPSYATNKNVRWTSSDSKVVSVSSSGVITAVGVGTSNITVRSEEGGYIATCKVRVIQPVSGVKLNKTESKLTIGKKDTVKLSATVSPSDASIKTVIWSSSDTKIATVSSSGLVTAKGPGTAVITAVTASGNYKAECKVTVIQPLKSIKFSSSKATFYVSEKKALTVIFNPTDASNKKVSYKTSDKSIATVNGSGVVTAKKKGTCTITAVSDEDGYKATCTVKVVGKVDVKSVEITKSSVSLYKGKTKQLTAKINPDNASVKGVKWTSSDKNVASVNSKGVVTAHKGGTCTIKCTSIDSDVYAKCKVTVKENPTEIKLDASTMTLDVGKTKSLTAEFSPSTATETDVKWTSSDTRVAKVSSSGKITAIKAGTCVIKAKSKANSSISAKCTLTVIQPPTKITLSRKTIEVDKGDSVSVTVSVSPSNAYNKSVIWKSSRPSVARVSSNGIITGRSAGSAVITCSSASDPSVKAVCNVTVRQPVTGISLSLQTLTMQSGSTKTLVATVTPSNATNKNVKFKTDNKDVARVNDKGVVEAVGPGKATITARTADGFYTAKCVVSVIESVRGVTLDKKSMNIELDKSKTLTATIRPNKATNKDVMWRSSNPLVARVTQDGKVTALREGTVLITCTTVNGCYTATCKVNCIIPVSAITLKDKDITLKKGATKTLKANIYPAEATIQTVTWQTSDKTVATVDANGKVTAVGKGVCLITCTTKQGGKKAYCPVVVK